MSVENKRKEGADVFSILCSDFDLCLVIDSSDSETKATPSLFLKRTIVDLVGQISEPRLTSSNLPHRTVR